MDGRCPPLTLGEQRWDYLYVEDAVNALISGAMCPTAHGVFNLASGEVHALRDVIASVHHLIDPTIALRFGELPYRADQVMHLEANVGRLKGETGWRPEVNLTEGLMRTVAWHKEVSIYAANR
jgi:nucleoside-diphosphate-sugar epimerase